MDESKREKSSARPQLIPVIRDDAAGELRFYCATDEQVGQVATAASRNGLTVVPSLASGAERHLGAVKMVVSKARRAERIPVVIDADVREAS